MSAIEVGVEGLKRVCDAEHAFARTHASRRQRTSFNRFDLLDLGQRANSGYADVNDFDRARNEAMAVFALMRLMKEPPSSLQVGGLEEAARERDLEFVSLSDVAQIAVAHKAKLVRIQMVGRELRLETPLHLGKVGIEPFKV